MTFPTTTQTRRLPASPSQVVNRQKSLVFSFDGRQYSAYEGDTIASALAVAGVATLSRSFKYHRRRGLLCVSGNCPNCLVQVGDEPNVRACTTPVCHGMAVESQNASPSLDVDVMSLTQLADRFLPAGFYYKAFMRPRALWPLYERVLRHAAGLGEVNPKAEPGHFDKVYKHADVTIVGGGPAGLRAALAAAEQGAQVILMDSEPSLGGHLRYASHLIDGQPAYGYITQLATRVSAHTNVMVMSNTTAFGRYDHNWIGAQSGDRLVKVRTKSLVVASGGYEIPLLFENNDLPGVILGSGIRRLIHLWGVVAGTRAVVVSANPRGLQTALDLRAAGMEVAAVAELRAAPDAEEVAQLESAGIDVQPNTTIIRANSRYGRVHSVVLKPSGSAAQEIDCDLLVLSTGYMPAYELLYQAGGKLLWDEAINEFAPVSLPEVVFAAGEAAGTHDLVDIEREGELAGLQAAAAAGFGSSTSALEKEVLERRVQRTAWTAVPLSVQAGKHDFVCLCEDVTRKDIKQSIDEGYDSMELLKRYSTVSMGPCQGKMCNVAAMHLCAHYNQQSIAETGTTTSRPPVRPVTMGVLAGRHMEPVRVTALHDWHVQHGAKMMNAGVWKRPEHYGDPLAEVRAVRQGVGLIDITTLGKFHLHGPDVPTLLERLYTNRWQKLGIGRVRYGIMLNNEGVVVDDGVTARLSDNYYYMTATSSGATQVYETIESYLQGGWELDVHVLDATELRAAMNLTGPYARDVLAKVTEGIDLSNAAFPYMNAREGKVAGAPALLLRVGFTGELGYEIHVPSGFGLHVWEALMEAGKEYGIVPFGVEAQRVMRLEKGHIIVTQDTDALTNPLEAGLEGLVKLDKEDFIGKTSLVLASQRGIQKRLVGFEMPDGTLPEEANQIVRPGKGPLGLEIIGRITSTRYSPTLNKVIGLCWLPEAMAHEGQEFTVWVRGQLKTGRVAPLPFYDPEGVRLNS
jgi:sarcosine oxidase subunit alpha